jgi:hypothetical protein
MRRVGHEPRLRRVRLVYPVEHTVYRDGQIFKLFLQVIHLYPRVETIAVDAVKLPRERHHVVIEPVGHVLQALRGM